MEGDGAARMRGRNGSRRVGVDILMISSHYFSIYIFGGRVEFESDSEEG